MVLIAGDEYDDMVMVMVMMTAAIHHKKQILSHGNHETRRCDDEKDEHD